MSIKRLAIVVEEVGHVGPVVLFSVCPVVSAVFGICYIELVYLFSGEIVD